MSPSWLDMLASQARVLLAEVQLRHTMGHSEGSVPAVTEAVLRALLVVVFFSQSLQLESETLLLE